MLLFDFHKIGDKLFAARRRAGLTQLDVATDAGISERTYADIERGTVNMRTETVLRICEVLHITPDDILTETAPTLELQQQELMLQLENCSPAERETALKLLSVYLDSLK